MGILGPPSIGIDATIRIGREMLFLPYAGFFPTNSWYVLLAVCASESGEISTGRVCYQRATPSNTVSLQGHLCEHLAIELDPTDLLSHSW